MKTPLFTADFHNNDKKKPIMFAFGGGINFLSYNTFNRLTGVSAVKQTKRYDVSTRQILTDGGTVTLAEIRETSTHCLNRS